MTNPEILKKLPFQIIARGIWEGTKYTPIREKWLKESDVLSALEEAREDERNQGRGEGPVWVNHDEGLPDDPHKQYVIRYKLLPIYEVWTLSHLLEMHKCAYVFEWLKEPDKLEQSKKEQ